MPAISVSKSIAIDAPPERVFEVVRDFRQWEKWSPWLIAEPDCSLEFAEDGSAYSWDGRVIGSGGIAVVSEKENSRIEYDLRFYKPWKSQADVAFSFQDEGGKTMVSWTMESSLPFFMFFMKDMMTAMIGCDYERGLLMLKDYVETGSVPSKLEFGEQSCEEMQVVGIRTECALSDVGEKMGEDMTRLGAWMAEADCEPAGNPLSIYHNWDPVKETTEYTIGFPVKTVPENRGEGIVGTTIPALQTYTVTHTGPYHHLSNAWSAGMMRGRSKVFKQSKAFPPFEFYQNDPESTPPEELVTVVNLPMK